MGLKGFDYPALFYSKIFLLMSLGLVLLIPLLLEGFGVPKKWALVAGIVFCLNPSLILYEKFLPFAIILSATVCAYLGILYILDTLKTKDTGITTEFALLYAFVIGQLITLNVIPVQTILAVTIVVILLLSKKDTIKRITNDIRRDEINSFISYAVIALVILPFLPNMSYSLSDIPQIKPLLEGLGVSGKLASVEFFNPFKLWLIVTLITGVDMIGYILERTLGQRKGWILASIAGGFISSTATTQSLAQQSKESVSVNHLVAAAIISNLTSFFQIAILIGSISPPFLSKTVPSLLFLIISAGVATYYFLRRYKNQAKTHVALKPHSMFALVPALKFAVIFLVITIISKVSLSLFGTAGLLITSAFGALAGLDAVMINTATLAGNNVDYRTAVLTFILANAVNLAAKSVYSFVQGKKEFAIKFSASVLAMTLASLLGLFFV
jgi:uncharacterized membrane protein (DUF4010 family)